MTILCIRAVFVFDIAAVCDMDKYCLFVNEEDPPSTEDYLCSLPTIGKLVHMGGDVERTEECCLTWAMFCLVVPNNYMHFLDNFVDRFSVCEIEENNGYKRVTVQPCERIGQNDALHLVYRMQGRKDEVNICAKTAKDEARLLEYAKLFTPLLPFSHIYIISNVHTPTNYIDCQQMFQNHHSTFAFEDSAV